MAQQVISIGAFINDRNTDTLPNALNKIKAMWTELYAVAGGTPPSIPNVNTEKVRDAFVKINTSTAHLFPALGASGRQAIDVGSGYDVPTIDVVRSGLDKVNTMFATLYAALPSGDSSYGPVQSQTQPPGSITIAAGSTSAQIQAAITAGSNSAVFWFPAGNYPFSSRVIPKTGQSYVGQYGAVFNGAGWSDADTFSGAFNGHNANIDNVTFKNLTFRNMPQKAIHGWYSGCDGWLIERCEVDNCKSGVNLGNTTIVRRCYIHHNMGPSPDSADTNLRGGGYGAYRATGPVFEYNDISFNGSEQKMVITDGAVFRGNYVHDNYRDGIWYDIDNINGLIEDNLVEDHVRDGIFHEINPPNSGFIIRNNTLRRNGTPTHNGAGIFISTAGGSEVYGNYIQAGYRSIWLFLDCNRVTATRDLANNHIYNNTIVMTAATQWASAFTVSGACGADYVNQLKDNTFENNTYWVPNTTGSWWNWGGVKTWAQWQALGHDDTGTRNIGAP